MVGLWPPAPDDETGSAASSASAFDPSRRLTCPADYQSSDTCWTGLAIRSGSDLPKGAGGDEIVATTNSIFDKELLNRMKSSKQVSRLRNAKHQIRERRHKH